MVVSEGFVWSSTTEEPLFQKTPYITAENLTQIYWKISPVNIKYWKILYSLSLAEKYT